MTLHSEIFYNYKGTTTSKGLIGVAPCEAVTRKSGILNLLEPGNEVMLDKGFTIDNLLSSDGASLVIPLFKREAQFSKSDCDQTQAIAQLAERVTHRVKEYHIWDCVVPLSLSGSVNQI